MSSSAKDSWESSSPSLLPERAPFGHVAGHLRRTWKSGEHWGILAPTRKGKTVLVTQGILPAILPGGARRRGLVLDPKGGVDNLQWIRPMGARKIGQFPPPSIFRMFGREAYPDRTYWLNPTLKDARKRFGEAMSEVWSQGGKHAEWVVYSDEIKLLSDTRELKLGRYLTRFLRYGAGKRITFIGGTQSPRWNGPEMSDLYDQPVWFALGRTSDRRTIDRYGEISGFDADVARKVLPRLRPFEFWIIGPDDYSVVTKVQLRRAIPKRKGR